MTDLKIDEATGKITHFRFANRKQAKRVARFIRHLDDYDDRALEAAFKKLDPTDRPIVIVIMEALAQDELMRWRIEGNRLVPMMVE